MNSVKSQSAMEYLITYGWAILVICIVVAALFELGLFCPEMYAAKAPPGSCHVSNSTYGPSTLVGVCSNYLPQFVTMFLGSNGGIGSGLGTPSMFQIPDSKSLDFPGNQITISLWAKTTSSPGDWGYIVVKDNAEYDDRGYLIYTGYNDHLYASFGTNDAGPTAPFGMGDGVVTPDFGFVWTPNTWYYIVATYSGTRASIYVNGVLEASSNPANYPLVLSTNPEYIGGYGNPDEGPCCSFNGAISNVQVYSSVLSANSISALYQGGIGGVPINTQNLVGWWSLNGNGNDSSRYRDNSNSILGPVAYVPAVC